MTFQQPSLFEDRSADGLAAGFELLHPRALLIARDGSVAAIGGEFASVLAGTDLVALASTAVRALGRHNDRETRRGFCLLGSPGVPLLASATPALAREFAVTLRLGPRQGSNAEDSLARELLGFVEAPIALLDGDGFFLAASPALVRGLSLACFSELQGAPLAAVLGDFEEAADAAKLLSRRHSDRATLRLRCAGGLQRNALVRAKPVRGNGHALFFEWEDRAPAPLEALAHDLRSPLSAVLGFARLAREDLAASTISRAAHLITRIEQSASTMDAMLRGALAPVRNNETADVSQVLEQIRAERKRELEQRGIQLVSPHDPPVLACRQSELYRLLSNLVGNAVDHMGEARSPEIAVSVACSGELATLSVRDNGVGIARELHERIFEVEHTGCVSEERTCHRGLGLAIVRELAATWRGSAWVESALGAGAAFFVTIPLAR